MSDAALDPSASDSAIKQWLRQRWRWLAALVALILIYALLGFLWAPRLIASYATQYVHDQLHRQLALGAVHFNPFTLNLRIDAARLTESTGAPIVGVKQLIVNAELSSLFTGSYNFSLVQVDAPTIHAIVNKAGAFNLSFSDATQPKAKADTPPAALPAIRIDDFRLSGGELHLQDNSRPTPFTTELKPIVFTLKNFSTEPRYGNAFHFKASSEDAETFDWQGNFSIQPFASQGKLSVGNLKSATVQSYLQDALPLRLLGGSVSLNGDYQVTFNDSLDAQLQLTKIALADLQVAPKSGDQPAWITASAITVSDLNLSWLKRSVAVQSLAIDNARVDVWLDAQRNLNLLELLGPSSPPSDKPWTVSVNDIAVNNTSVSMEDRAVMPAAKWVLQPLSVQVKNLSTQPGSSINLDLAANINEQAKLSATGTVNLDSLSSAIKMQLDNFALKDLQAYAAAATDMTINAGLLSATGDVSYLGKSDGKQTSKQPLMKFVGDVTVKDLATTDSVENKDFIKWQSVQFAKVNMSMAPAALEIKEITAYQPYGKLTINSDGSTNIQHVLRIKPKPKDAPEAHAAAATKPANTGTVMRTRIAKVIIKDGSASFTDDTVKPTFATGIEQLNGEVTGLSSANDSRAQLMLNGSVDNYAPVSIMGAANFLAAQTYSDIAMNFRNMELTTFNPYSGKFAGYSIAKGKLATELRYQIENRKLNAQHHIVIDQLEFGAATDSKDAVPLPIKLAAALLKDRNGVIDLNLPVSGSLDDPSFKVGPIIWKAFVGLLTKIVTAPFAALGALFGGDSEQLSYVDFAPGSAMLMNTETIKLTTLAKAMVERPQLKLNIPLTVITDADAAALNEASFKDAVAGVLPNAGSATPQQRLAALITLHQRKLNSAPAFPATEAGADVTSARIAYLESILKPQFAITAADRDALTRARANAVQAALLTNPELSAERIYLTARSNEAQSPGVARMELKLE